MPKHWFPLHLVNWTMPFEYTILCFCYSWTIYTVCYPLGIISSCCQLDEYKSLIWIAQSIKTRYKLHGVVWTCYHRQSWMKNLLSMEICIYLFRLSKSLKIRKHLAVTQIFFFQYKPMLNSTGFKLVIN